LNFDQPQFAGYTYRKNLPTTRRPLGPNVSPTALTCWAKVVRKFPCWYMAHISQSLSNCRCYMSGHLTNNIPGRRIRMQTHNVRRIVIRGLSEEARTCSLPSPRLGAIGFIVVCVRSYLEFGQNIGWFRNRIYNGR